MVGSILVTAFVILFVLSFLAWRRYLWAAQKGQNPQQDNSEYGLTDVFGDQHLLSASHQEGVRWLPEVFSRSARRFPDHTALQIPYTGESLTFSELDAHSENVAAAIAPFLNGPDQVVAVAMSQDNWQIVACHLGILKAGGTVMFLDTTMPQALIEHMLEDAGPVVILTRGQDKFRDFPTLDVLKVPKTETRSELPTWLDDPTQRLATIFYTSGTTGMPKGVECPHAGYVNLSQTYADYFDLVAGIDATSLTSSLGYDGSISEMYSAWVSGCAVVMLTKEQMRSGPDLVPILCKAEVTVLFCPPVLLTTLTPTPELDLPFPICRYIVPAGEAFPATLVEPWTRGRRQIINTYGPTEASTDTSRQSLRPGEPVTIGSPFANVTYVILKVNQLHPLHHGEVGELCIGGVHVARGYRNLPELTAEKFIDHPQFGRLYRTGDKCRIDIRTQRVHFLGRVDDQIKVRGHRVEVQGVEDILQTQFQDIESAVLDYQNEELVAFVVAPSVHDGEILVAKQPPPDWVENIKACLERQLPEASVPTRIFLVEKFTIKAVSGKIDRTCLPDLSRLPTYTIPASNPGTEEVLNGSVSDRPEKAGLKTSSFETDPPPQPGSEAILSICRDVLESQLGWDDVFTDHGGHSIAIARLAQQLHAAGWVVPVRALLSNCNTARKISEFISIVDQVTESPQTETELNKDAPVRNEAMARVLSIRYFTMMQVVYLSVLYSPHFLGIVLVIGFGDIGNFFITARFAEFVGVGILMYLFALALPFISLFWVLILKYFVSGEKSGKKAAPGAYPKWSQMHLRIWWIGRLEASVVRPLGTMFRSAPLMAYVLRQLGATVGDNLHCSHEVEFSGPLDLLTIEDDVTIQPGAYIQLSSWVGSELHIGPTHLESGCKIGMRAGVANSTKVGRGTWITPLTPVLSDVGAGEIWEGAPAQNVGRCTKLNRTADRCRSAYPLWLSETLNILMQVILEFFLAILPVTTVAWFVATFMPVREIESAGQYLATTSLIEVIWQIGLYAFVTSWVTIILISVLICLFIRCSGLPQGVYPSRELRGALMMYRLKKMNQIQRIWTWTITGQYLRALAGLRFTHLGASECDVMLNLVPELATADTTVFWSHGCFTNMLDQNASHLTLRHLDMPANFFSSSNSVAESGNLQSNLLLGIATPGNDIEFRRQMQSRLGEPITAAGNPPVRFASANFEAEGETKRLPSFSLFLARFFLNDIFSIGFLPIAELFAYAAIFTVLRYLDIHLLVSVVFALFLTELVLVSFSVAVKKLLVGDSWGTASSAPFWSWRHFSYFFAQDCFFAWGRLSMGLTAGTLLSNNFLRWMGCRIGKRTIVSAPLQAFDWNAVSIGDNCIINGLLQFHSFENMTLKVKQTKIQDGSAVNFGATVMGGVVIEPGTTIMPLSLVLKEMNLPTGIYEGSPAELAAISPSTPPQTIGSKCPV